MTRLEQAKQADGGVLLAHVVNTAIKLGIFRELRDAAASPHDLAVALSLNASATGRLLAALRGIGYVEFVEHYFVNTDLGDNATTLEIPVLPQPAGPLVKLWPYLLDAIREGGPQMKRAFGIDGDIFFVIYRDPAQLEGFCRFMLKFSVPAGIEIAKAVDFSKNRTVMDVAGGLGGSLVEILKAHPHLSGSLMELREVLSLAEGYLDRCGFRRRIFTTDADLFGSYYPIGSDADVALLGWVLHDWNDKHCAQILTNVYEMLPSGGKLLLSECVLEDDGSGKQYAEFLSLVLLEL